jgi:hypothetical protein
MGMLYAGDEDVNVHDSAVATLHAVGSEPAELRPPASGYPTGRWQLVRASRTF